MSQTVRWTLVAALFVAILVGILNRGDSWELTPTSHGIIPPGHGAAYEMLRQLGFGEGRSYESEAGLPEAGTVWWIEPAGLCRGAEDEPLEEGDSGVWRATEWIQRGGTAVVFLPDRRLPCLDDRLLLGGPLPTRDIDIDDEDAFWEEAQEGEGENEYEAEERSSATALVGSALRQSRSLEGVPLHFFRDTAGYEVLVADASQGPFVVSREIGAGRLVLAASALPLRNRWLRTADAAPFVVDLALALGSPRVDEREHGLLPRPSPIRFLLTSAALPSIAGVTLLGMLLVWRARSDPPLLLEPDLPAPPTLDTYIGSVAGLYRSTRDHGEVLRSYQEFALSQLRRLQRLPPDASLDQIQTRLLTSRGLSAADLGVVLDSPACSKRSELLAATARIDALLERVSR
jgi:hypothetical protein